MFHGFVLVRLPVGSRKTALKSGLKVAATLGLFLGPGSPPKGARRPARDRHRSVKCASRLGGAPILEKLIKSMKNAHFENVHTSRVPGSFWPTEDAKSTLITTVCRVSRRVRSNGPREPFQGPKVHHRCSWAVLIVRARTLARRNAYYEWEIEAPLERQRLFGKVGEGRRYGRLA